VAVRGGDIYLVISSKMPTTFNVVLIRHGESLNNTIYDAVRLRLGEDVTEQVMEEEESRLRQPDPSLSERGFEQARRLGQFIGTCGGMFCGQTLFGSSESWQIYSSPMLRALLTTREMVAPAKALNPSLTVRVRHDLYESGGCHDQHSALPGSTKSDIESAFPGFVCESGMEEGWYAGNAGQETSQQFIDRMDRIAEWLIALRRNVILVCHGNLISGLINRLILSSMGNKRHTGVGCLFTHNNTGYSHLQLIPQTLPEEAITAVMAVNRTDHLLVPDDAHLIAGSHPFDDHWVQEYLPVLGATRTD